jgi:hypothetical protein
MQQPCILSAGLTRADSFAIHEMELSSSWQTDYINERLHEQQQQQRQPL